mmetsp:Transcript_27485/g.31687  ORF Transcript_27485/g.31687 Transcript_27485/m.31687 type:complete len:301 (-) Transcript_27485:114-1016(-)
MWSPQYGNRLCKEANIKRDHLAHKKGLANVQPRVDSEEPMSNKKYKKITNPKRLQLEEERRTKIRVENYHLFSKMQNISVNPTKHHPSSIVHEASPARNGLHKHSRFREMYRIASENQDILGRLKKSRSHYNIRKINSDSNFQEYLKRQISRNSGRTQFAKFTLNLDTGFGSSYSNAMDSMSRTSTSSKLKSRGTPSSSSSLVSSLGKKSTKSSMNGSHKGKRISRSCVDKPVSKGGLEVDKPTELSRKKGKRGHMRTKSAGKIKIKSLKTADKQMKTLETETPLSERGQGSTLVVETEP